MVPGSSYEQPTSEIGSLAHSITLSATAHIVMVQAAKKS
jgi:hypothetical protein